MNIGKNNKDVPNNSHVDMDVKFGSMGEMTKAKKDNLSNITESIEDFLKDYDGGLISISLLKTDKNNKTTTKESMLLGIGTPEQTIDMSRMLHEFSHKSVDALKDKLPTEVAIQEIVKYLKNDKDAPEWLKNL